MIQFLRLYVVCAVAQAALDYTWLGVIASGFYRRHMGHLLRADVQWLPAALFYLVYAAALAAIVVQPAVEKQSLARAVGFGALFGLAAYSAYDLTSLAVMKDFPVGAAVVDLVWGTAATATVAGIGYWSSRFWT